MKVTVTIRGLKEFRSALKNVEGASPRMVSRALKRPGEQILEPRAVELAPRRDGDLARSARIRVRGTKASLVFLAPYSMGAEFGLHGKWKGFRKYGARANRFGFKALEETGDELADAITEELRDLITVLGWFREG